MKLEVAFQPTAVDSDIRVERVQCRLVRSPRSMSMTSFVPCNGSLTNQRVVERDHPLLQGGRSTGSGTVTDAGRCLLRDKPAARTLEVQVSTPHVHTP